MTELKWNEKWQEQNQVRYPDNPDLEQALNSFRQQYSWYEQQIKYRKRGVDTTAIYDAWHIFLKLRNQHEHSSRSSNSVPVSDPRAR